MTMGDLRGKLDDLREKLSVCEREHVQVDGKTYLEYVLPPEVWQSYVLAKRPVNSVCTNRLISHLGGMGVPVILIEEDYGRGLFYDNVHQIRVPLIKLSKREETLARIRVVTTEEPGFAVGYHVLAFEDPNGEQGWDGGYYAVHLVAPLNANGVESIIRLLQSQ